MEARTPVIALDHPSAFDATRVGGKAATLAVARAAGLPAGPGVVLTTEWSPEQVGLTHEVWRIISHDGAQALVVRRSSTVRVMRAEQELSAVGAVRVVANAAEFAAAVDAVHDQSTAVLVQPVADAAWRGVVFGDGPTTGRRTRPVVACVAADSPAEVWVAEIDHHGRTCDIMSAGGAAHPQLELLSRVARLSRLVDRTFEGQRDVDWLARPDGTLRLVDIRPGLDDVSRSTAGPAGERDAAIDSTASRPACSRRPGRHRRRRRRRAATAIEIVPGQPNAAAGATRVERGTWWADGAEPCDHDASSRRRGTSVERRNQALRPGSPRSQAARQPRPSAQLPSTTAATLRPAALDWRNHGDRRRTDRRRHRGRQRHRPGPGTSAWRRPACTSCWPTSRRTPLRRPPGRSLGAVGRCTPWSPTSASNPPWTSWPERRWSASGRSTSCATTPGWPPAPTRGSVRWPHGSG